MAYNPATPNWPESWCLHGYRHTQSNRCSPPLRPPPLCFSSHLLHLLSPTSCRQAWSQTLICHLLQPASLIMHAAFAATRHNTSAFCYFDLVRINSWKWLKKCEFHQTRLSWSEWTFFFLMSAQRLNIFKQIALKQTKNKQTPKQMFECQTLPGWSGWIQHFAESQTAEPLSRSHMPAEWRWPPDTWHRFMRSCRTVTHSTL